MAKWLDKEEFRLSELYNKYGNDYSKIAEVLTEEFDRKFTYNATRNKIRRSSIIEYISNKKGEGIFEGLDDNEEFNEYVEAKGKIKEVMDKFDKNYGDKDVDVLVISDLHVPLVDLDALEKVLLENQDCDICIIAGDFLDFKAISTYGNKREVSVEEEYRYGFEVLKRICDIFEWVIIHEGNHCQRITRYFSSKIVTALSGYLTDKHKPLGEITRFFEDKNLDYVPHWFAQIGDLLTVHSSRYSKVKLRTVRNVIDDRIEKNHTEEFAPFSTVISGHTHVAGKSEFSGKIGCEIGCLQQLNTAYRHSDAKGRNWVHAFGRVKIRKGKTNWNDVEVKLVD